MFYVLAFIYSLYVIPPIIYLLVISLAGIKRPIQDSIAPVTGTIGVLVPAHNEKLNIKRTLNSLLNAASNSSDIEINVIADNCSDDTAAIARQSPVNVLERENEHLRGKGAALQWGMSELDSKDYDYITIIDADSIVNDDFFKELRIALNQPDCQVVQARYEALANEHSSIKRLAMLGFNVLRARGRVAIGGSAGIMGNGFTLSKAALAAAPFRANSIVEDLEYHMRLIETDITVDFCDSARVYGEMPQDNTASDVQSTRWEGGRLGVLKAAWWPLLKKSCSGLFKKQAKKQWHALDALLDLMLLPIGYMVFVLLLGLLFPYTQIVSLAGFAVVGIYVLGAASCGNGISELSVLIKLPSFLWRKLRRIPSLIVSSSTKTRWKRTPRDKE